MNQEKIGKLIAKLRKEKGLTQQQLGDMVGVGYRAVSKWETGITMPDISIINELCKILGITSDELLKGEQRKKDQAKSHNYSIKQLLMIIIPIIIIISVIIGIIIKHNSKIYEYDLKSANPSDYQVEGKLKIKGNKMAIQIDKLQFVDHDFKQLQIKNYGYNIFSNDKLLFGFGYDSTSEILLNQTYIHEFQKTFIINCKDIPITSRETIIGNNLILKFKFIDADDNTIYKDIEIIPVSINNTKSTK